MRVLLDECVDRRLARDIVGHEVRTVPQMGWATIRNSDLLVLAEGQFDAFVIVDRNLALIVTSRSMPAMSAAATIRPRSS